MSRPRHPNKHIEAAVRYAESLGWRVQICQGHAWGRLFCPQRSRDGCKVSVWSTPHNPENHARHLRRIIDTCPHQPQPEPEQQREEEASEEREEQEDGETEGV